MKYEGGEIEKAEYTKKTGTIFSSTSFLIEPKQFACSLEKCSLKNIQLSTDIYLQTGMGLDRVDYWLVFEVMNFYGSKQSKSICTMKSLRSEHDRVHSNFCTVETRTQILE
jgi:hypothetical protein